MYTLKEYISVRKDIASFVLNLFNSLINRSKNERQQL